MKTWIGTCHSPEATIAILPLYQLFVRFGGLEAFDATKGLHRRLAQTGIDGVACGRLINRRILNRRILALQSSVVETRGDAGAPTLSAASHAQHTELDARSATSDQTASDVAVGSRGMAGLGVPAPDRAAGVPPFPSRPLTFLWHFIRRSPSIHAAALGSVVGAAACACVAQYGLKLIVDASSEGPASISRVWWALAVFLGLLAAESALWRAASFFGFRAILADKTAIKLDLFAHLSGHSTLYFAERMGGSLVSRISSTGDSVQQLLTLVLFTITPIFTDFCVASVMLALIDWQLVAALVAFIVLSDGLLVLLSRGGARRYLEYAGRSAQTGGELADALSNIWLIKAFSARTRELARFEHLLEAEADAHRESLFYVERMRVGHDIGLWLMAGSILGWSVYLWSRGRISVGDIILTAATVFRVLRYSRDLAFALVNSTQFVSRIAEAVGVIGEPHGVVDRPGARDVVPARGSISFEYVNFTYPSGRTVLHDFNLEIEPGQRVGLVGPSGAGKSTLIGLVQRVADIDGGRLLVDGEDIRTIAQETLRAAIAVVPQEVLLFHRSVLENIRYARPDASLEEVQAAAAAARCDEFIHRLPEGYDTIVGERGRKLSGGERQRLGIARALLKDAPIIILDEATSSLDTESEIEIHLALEALMRGRTVLGIAHRLSTVAHFDRIVVLHDGRIVEDGRPAELRHRGGLFDQMCRLQERGAVMPRQEPDASLDPI
jgi:ATP-binding cassette, subfamily B, bacterial